MRSEQTRFSDIFKYCISSPGYKENSSNQNTFLAAVQEVDGKVLLIMLERLHLLGLFYDALKKLDSQHALLKTAHHYIEYSTIFINRIIEELKMIHQRLTEFEIKPILLKGASLWGSVYNPYYLRKSYDVDLLVTDLDTLAIIDRELKALKYTTGEDYEAFFNAPDQYELSQYQIKISIKVKPETAWHLDQAIKIFDIRNLDKVDHDTYCFWLHIDLQKAIYMLVNCTMIVPEAKHLTLSKTFDGYYLLTDAPSLTYIATKFMIDRQLYMNGKENFNSALKLAADFIRILMRADQDTISESITLAKRWGGVKNYFFLLNATAELVPEVNMQDLVEAPNVNVIDSYAALLVENYVEKVLV